MSQPPVSPAGGRHRKQPTHRWRFLSKLRVIATITAITLSLGAFALVFGRAGNLVEEAAPSVGAQVTAPPGVTAPAAAPPISEPAARPPVDGAPPFRIDRQGFVDSAARCDRSQTLAALGRTHGSFVAICRFANGRLEYRGVRASDAAVLRAEAESPTPQRFLVHRPGVTYTVNPTELLVTTGNTVIKRESMVEYRAG
ncbi:MAG TPA: hypothetical protein VHH12_15980 [Mycobacterium sp.]|nr:hypothetical protein [Mycobacterium sp.]